MRRFQYFFDFYINSSIHVSLAVVALTLVTGYSLDISVESPLLLFVFFSSVTGYNFVKYAKVAGLHHRSLARSLRVIQIFSMLCGVGMVLTIFWLQWEVIATAAFLGLLTFLYAIPFIPALSNTTLVKRNLRTIGGIKIYMIALVWAGTTTILPLLDNGFGMYWDAWVVFIQRFLVVLALMVPFEIRDLPYDSSQLKTLPQQMGVKRTKFVGISWLVVFVLLEFLKDELEVSMVLIHLMVAVLVGVGIMLSRKHQRPYFTSFWIEGIPLVWLWITLVISRGDY